MAGGIDLDKLKSGIAERKKELSVRTNALGETVQVKQTGDAFLRELMHSATTGAETHASVKVKTVDQLAEAKITGKTVDPNLLGHVATSAPTQSIQQPAQVNAHIPSAAEVAKMNEAKRIREQSNVNYNQTMGQPASNVGVADAISQFQNMGRVGAPMNNNSMLTEQQMMGNIMGSAPAQIIVEQTQQILNENFGHLFAEAMKNSIIETYKAEVIKSGLDENKEYIKEIVIETILELQKRNQSKK